MAPSSSSSSSSSSSTSSSSSLSAFLTPARALAADDTAGAAALVAAALRAPSVFFFGELCDVAAVDALRSSADAAHVALHRRLDVFTYGTLGDYDAATMGGELTAAERRKLQQLTLVSMALERKVIDYDDVRRALALSDDDEQQQQRTLEDLIIDTVYAGLLQARLDQRARCVHVDFAAGRDVRASALPAVVDALRTWRTQCDAVTATLHARIEQAQSEHTAASLHADELARRVQTAKDALHAASLAGDGGGSGGGGGGGGGGAMMSTGGLGAAELLDDAEGGVGGGGGDMRRRKAKRGAK